jgi:hypothetical protein
MRMKHHKSSLATYIKKTIAYLLIVFVVIGLSSCNSRVHHTDEFYNDDGDFPALRFPLMKPYYVDRFDSRNPWVLRLNGHLWIDIGAYAYKYDVVDVRKISVENGIIMAYSPYVADQPFDDPQVNQSIREHYYHWFVAIPGKSIEEGFENESAFLEYIHGLGVQQPNWQAPDDLFGEFAQTGCLNWIPDCK